MARNGQAEVKSKTGTSKGLEGEDFRRAAFVGVTVGDKIAGATVQIERTGMATISLISIASFTINGSP